MLRTRDNRRQNHYKNSIRTRYFSRHWLFFSLSLSLLNTIGILHPCSGFVGWFGLRNPLTHCSACAIIMLYSWTTTVNDFHFRQNIVYVGFQLVIILSSSLVVISFVRGTWKPASLFNISCVDLCSHHIITLSSRDSWCLNHRPECLFRLFG